MAGSGGVLITRTINPLASGGVPLQNQTTINPAVLEEPPSYQEALEHDEAARLMSGDTAMNDSLEMQSGLEDEAIDVNPGYNSFNHSRNDSALLDKTWSFSNLPNLETGSSTRANPSGRASEIDLEEIDDRSDIVQNNSSASDGSRERRAEDFEDAEPDGDWRAPTPIPEVSEQDQLALMDLHVDLSKQGSRKRFGDMDIEMEVKVPPHVSDDVDEEAAEIHVEEGEGTVR